MTYFVIDLLILTIPALAFSYCALLCKVLYKKKIEVNIYNKRIGKAIEYSKMHFAWLEKKQLSANKCKEIENITKSEYLRYWGEKEIVW